MKKIIFFFLITLLLEFGFCQVGINTESPHPSSVLDLKSTNGNRGLLIPRVNLNSTIDITTIPNPAKGLLVYNLQTSGVDDNKVDANYIYVFDGENWKKLTSKNELLSSQDLPQVIVNGRKTTVDTPCNGITSGVFDLNEISNSTILSSTGSFKAPKDGYYLFSIKFNFLMRSNPSQSFEISPHIYSDGLVVHSFRFRGDGYVDQNGGITGTVYLTKDQITDPIYWNFGSNNTCGTTGRIKNQEVVWEYLGNP